MFLSLWSQVWVLQLLKESRYTFDGAPPCCVLALACAVVSSWVALLLRRGLVVARVVLAVVGLWYLAARGSSSNHVALQAVVCVAVLETASRRDGGGVAALRLGSMQVLSALYLVTAVAKCNAGWLDVGSSCATLYTVAGGAEVPAAPAPSRGVLAPLPVVAIFGEFALALAFFLRARGALGSHGARLGLVLLGTAFHVGLATPRPPLSVYPFSALMAPLFALADEDVDVSETPLFQSGTGALGALAAAMLYAAELAGDREPTRVEYPPYCSWDLGLLWCVGAFGLVLRRAAGQRPAPPQARGVGSPTEFGSTSTSKRRPRGPRRGAREATPEARGAPCATLLLLAIGALPYLGLRTHPCFTMFSNLRLEGGVSNHFVFTSRLLRRLDLGRGAMADVVVVKAANVGAVAHMQVDLGHWLAPHVGDALDAARASKRFFISPPAAAWPPKSWPAVDLAFAPFATPFVELRRRVSDHVRRHPDAEFRLDYDRNGRRFAFARHADGSLDPGSDPELLEPLEPFWNALFKFRTFEPNAEAPSPCRH